MLQADAISMTAAVTHIAAAGSTLPKGIGITTIKAINPIAAAVHDRL